MFKKLFTKKRSRIFNLYRVFRALFISQYALMVEYRAEIALWAISGTLPLIMLSLWSNSQAIYSFGYNPINLAHYFISAFVVRQFTAVWVMVSLEEDNLEGKISPYLLQPVPPIFRYLFSHISEQFSRLPLVLLMIFLLFLFKPNYFWLPNIGSLIISIGTIFIAFLLRFLIHWIFAMICFFTDKASSLERLLLIPYLFLSGMIAPLEAYPEQIKQFALLTPFPYILYLPSKMLSSQSFNQTINIEVLFIWIVVLSIVSVFTWRIGVKHYSAMGA